MQFLGRGMRRLGVDAADTTFDDLRRELDKVTAAAPPSAPDLHRVAELKREVVAVRQRFVEYAALLQDVVLDAVRETRTKRVVPVVVEQHTGHVDTFQQRYDALQRVIADERRAANLLPRVVVNVESPGNRLDVIVELAQARAEHQAPRCGWQPSDNASACQDEVAALRAALSREVDRNAALVANAGALARTHERVRALVEAGSTSSMSELLSLRCDLQAGLARETTLRADLDDARHEGEELRRRQGELESLLKESRRKVLDEEALVQRLTTERRESEETWLARMEAMREEMRAEAELWKDEQSKEMERHRRSFRERHRLLDEQCAAREAALAERHEKEIAQLVILHDEQVQRLQDEIRTYEGMVPVAVVNDKVADVESRWADERRHWEASRSASLAEHEDMRSQIATLRGQLHEIRAKHADTTKALQDAQAATVADRDSAERRVQDAWRAARDEARADLIAERDRWQADHQQIVTDMQSRARDAIAAYEQKLDAAADVARALDARIGELTAERARSAHRIAALEDQVRCVTEAATQADADARAERHRALELAEERRAQDLAGAAQQSAAALAQVREEGRRAVLEALEAARADLDRQRLEWARDADERLQRELSAREASTVAQWQSRVEADADRMRAVVEGHAAQVSEMSSRLEAARDKFESDLNRQVAAHNAEVAALRSQIDALAGDVANERLAATEARQRCATLDALRVDVESAALERDRKRAEEWTEQKAELTVLVQRQAEEFAKERQALLNRISEQRARHAEEHAELVERARDSLPEDRERIRVLEVEAARQQAAAEQIVNEVRFYKLELVNRDEALLKRFGDPEQSRSRPSVPGAKPHLASVPRRRPREGQLPVVVNLNNQAGLGPGNGGVPRPRQIIQHHWSSSS